jgi:hypothetical protein
MFSVPPTGTQALPSNRLANSWAWSPIPSPHATNAVLPRPVTYGLLVKSSVAMFSAEPTGVQVAPSRRLTWTWLPGGASSVHATYGTPATLVMRGRLASCVPDTLSEPPRCVQPAPSSRATLICSAVPSASSQAR